MKAPAANVLRIGGGNAYYKNPNPRGAVAAAARSGAHSFLFSEGSRLPIHLAARPRLRPLLPMRGFADRVDSLDCCGFVRRNLTLRHHSFSQVCDALPSGPAQSRTFAMVTYVHPRVGTVTHVGIHPNWVAGLDGRKHPIIRAYLDAIPRLDAMLTLADTLGDHVVVTGDFNSHEGDHKAFRTVYDVFGDHRLHVRTEGLDGGAWSRNLALAAWHRIPGKTVGSDHDYWTVLDLTRRT